jgi:hypothetical protein
MSDYSVSVFFEGRELDYFDIKIKHFRQYEGRNVSTHGGHTAIFDTQLGLVFSSKCRNDEQFSRQKGVLTCLQKMFDTKVCPYPGKYIVDFTAGANGIRVDVSTSPHEKGANWWLNG